MKGIARHAVARQLRVNARLARSRAASVLEHHERGALADGHAAPITIEGTARRRVEELQRIEPHEADPRQCIDSAGDRQRSDTVRHEIGRERERHGPGAAGRHDRLARPTEAQGAPDDIGVRGRKARRESPRHGLEDTARTLPVPCFGFQHPSADRTHDQRGLRTLSANDPGVVQRFARGGKGQSVGPRAPCRAADAGRHLGRDPATEALGVDQGDRSDGADAATDPLPVGLHAGPERADDPEPRDGYGLHAPAVLDAT